MLKVIMWITQLNYFKGFSFHWEVYVGRTKAEAKVTWPLNIRLDIVCSLVQQVRLLLEDGVLPAACNYITACHYI